MGKLFKVTVFVIYQYQLCRLAKWYCAAWIYIFFCDDVRIG